MSQTNQSTVQNAEWYLEKSTSTWTSTQTNALSGAKGTTDLAGVGIIVQGSTIGTLPKLNFFLVVPTQTPTNPPPLSEQITEQTRLGATVSRYAYEKSAYRRIVAYLNAHPDADKLLYDLPGIIDKIYGENIEKKLEIVADHDTEEDIMIVLFDSGVEGCDFLDKKETELFHRIEESSLGAGLFHVILSHI